MITGDSLHQLTLLTDGSVDAVVCDPPYGISFQGQRWDGRQIRETAQLGSPGRRLTAGEAFQTWTAEWGRECLRVLKPGAYLLAFGSPRTWHRLAAGLEDAGFELRDTLLWLYGTGMPKSRRLPGGTGTALKPAWEPILLCRRPPQDTIERTVARYGTGVLNIDAARVDRRWPANLTLTHSPDCTEHRCADDCPVKTIDEAADLTRVASESRIQVSRLFYTSKVSRRERDAGCDRLPAQELNLFPQAQGQAPAAARNPHPTVKPITLMRWLICLATPPSGLMLDPFCGSGSTGIAAVLEGRQFLGIEREPAYVKIARARITHWTSTSQPQEDRLEQRDRPFALGGRRYRG